MFFSLLHCNWRDYYIPVQDILRSKAVRDKEESINGKFDIRIDKGGNFGAEDVVVEENSHQSFWEKESNYETNNVNDRPGI